ncbi:ATP-binding protein [Leptolyngbya sp. FACHB-261]|uniref:ATP-binding protein n=1 Tax=Leptolyngbya sp. FACHB-261 TaxID=2692806 RepID=UPI0016838776|nr:ATP-binding protein [Leptolyngbya sp. FACHB-261]MBD2101261.1 amino acid permease [Leptolyngbya sp. FACHB-261]
MLNQDSATRLPRSLTALETWGFSLTNLVAWIALAPIMQAALGSQALWVWLFGAISGVLYNLQVQHLGSQWPELVGGNPAYVARLLKPYPWLRRYVAIGYFLTWAATPAVSAIVFAALLKENLEPLGLPCPELPLKIGFTAIAFVVALSGTKALSVLHLCLVLPAIASLLLFCVQGVGWLALSPDSPGLLPSHWPSFSFNSWANWVFLALPTYYCSDTSAVFVGESRKPTAALRFLLLTACLIPVVFLGGSWVLMQLATRPELGNNPFLILVAVAQPFWGQSASAFVTLLVTAGLLLACATAVAVCPRFLYQFALDGELAPVFAVVSRTGVLEPALAFTFLISFLCLAWGDVPSLLVATGTSYFVTIMIVQLALWLSRQQPEVRWPHWSLGCLLLEAVVLVVAGATWRWTLLVGLLWPLAILAIDWAIQRLKFAPFQSNWWVQRYQKQRFGKANDSIAVQIIILLGLVCSALTLGWVMRAWLVPISAQPSANLLIVLLLLTAFLAVAIACWTSLPQVLAMLTARKQAEHLFEIALDAILVLDGDGVIRQLNPSTESLLGLSRAHLLGERLNELLTSLQDRPEHWPRRSEQFLTQDSQLRIFEVAVSNRFNSDFQEYVVILRDITEQKHSEAELQQLYRQVQELNAGLEHQVQERTAQLQQSLDFEALLKRITDKVRDSLDERQILQTVVQELALLLSVCYCDAALYSADYGTSTVHYESVQIQLPQGQKRVIAMTDFPEIYHQLLQGQCFQFCGSIPELHQVHEALLACPIVDDKGVLGDLWLHKQSEETFNDLEMRLVRQVANQCAIALRQANLYQSSQAQVKELEKLHQLKDDFLSTVSHELRSPLSNMKMAIHMLKTSKVEEKRERYLQILKNECARETDLINDLLDLQRLEAGVASPDWSLLNLTDWLPSLLEPFQSRIHQRQQSLHLDLVSDLPPLMTDQRGLERILTELLNNACKYTSPSGQITFTVRVASAPIPTAIFQICNEAEIPASELPHIFEKFYRVSSNDRWQQGGTGLGLALVQKLTTHLGGCIQVESALGQTCFTVVLPLGRAHASLDED